MTTPADYAALIYVAVALLVVAWLVAARQAHPEHDAAKAVNNPAVAFIAVLWPITLPAVTVIRVRELIKPSRTRRKRRELHGGPKHRKP